jgi:transposase
MLSIRDAAKIAGVSPDTVKTWIVGGMLDGKELPRPAGADPRGRRVRVSERQLRRLLTTDSE